MKNFTKGQKFFLLLILSAICIGAFFFVGCSGRNSCFGCDFRYGEDYFASSCLGINTAVSGDKYLEGRTGFFYSCDNCETTNSCGASAIGQADEGDNYAGIRFLADSVSKSDTNAIFGDASCFTEDDCSGCEVSCGTYSDDDGANISSIYITHDDYEVSCGESNDSSYIYESLKGWLKYFFS